ncbi:MAG TPA: hypothetical protein VGH27_02430 [Streptosporangiaceae bacterium]|jgi:hypothetical protein
MSKAAATHRDSASDAGLFADSELGFAAGQDGGVALAREVSQRCMVRRWPVTISADSSAAVWRGWLGSGGTGRRG